MKKLTIFSVIFMLLVVGNVVGSDMQTQQTFSPWAFWKKILEDKQQLKTSWERLTVNSEPLVMSKYYEDWTDEEPQFIFGHRQKFMATVLKENGKIQDEEQEKELHRSRVVLENGVPTELPCIHDNQKTASQYFKESPHCRIIGHAKNFDGTMSTTVEFNPERCRKTIRSSPHEIKCENDTVEYYICYRNFINPSR